MSQETFDHEYLICPYCGYKEEVGFETFFSKDLECDEKHECQECGKTFTATRSVIFCYETFKIKEE